MFRKVPEESFHEFSGYAENIPYGKIYPLSVTDGRQTGDIYTGGKAVLFWHHCGFAQICGSADESFIIEVKKLMLNGSRRLVLFADEKTAGYFGDGFAADKRLFFEYKKTAPPEYSLTEQYELRSLDRDLISRLDGRIVPSFSWDSTDSFLADGKGFCVTCQDKPCAWAFSAAVGGDETDIGVETAEDFRRKGLAYTAAAAMVKDILESRRKPVWACHANNAGSAKLAEKLGFVRAGECFVIHTV